MNDKPLLTIAIPTYNGSNTIKNLLNLVLPQCNSEVEFIISDNCSTDNTEDIVLEYKRLYPFIKYIRNKQDIGPDANFLQCFEIAEGRFVWLLSDDDIVIENSLQRILTFLKRHSDVSLLYLTTVDFRGQYKGLDHCKFHKPKLKKNIYTDSKNIFIKCARDYWGFVSSFICRKSDFDSINNPQRFYNTFWLQSYIQALCVAAPNAKMGVIKDPCVGAGIYVNTANFDTALVNGIYYKKMLDYIIQYAGFPKEELEELYVWRICFLGRHDLLKEKAAGYHKINKKLLISCTKKYPQAWITLYPFFLVPSWICKILMRIYRRLLGIKDSIHVNRLEETQ